MNDDEDVIVFTEVTVSAQYLRNCVDVANLPRHPPLEGWTTTVLDIPSIEDKYKFKEWLKHNATGKFTIAEMTDISQETFETKYIWLMGFENKSDALMIRLALS